MSRHAKAMLQKVIKGLPKKGFYLWGVFTYVAVYLFQEEEQHRANLWSLLSDIHTHDTMSRISNHVRADDHNCMPLKFHTPP